MRLCKALLEWLGALCSYDGRPNRRRVFSRGFMTFCLVISVIELALLTLFFAKPWGTLPSLSVFVNSITTILGL